MGYLTTYHLMGNRKLLAEFGEENEYAKHVLENEGECKWYEHEKDLREFSRKYPDELFLLEGHGEEQGDDWKKYFSNGLMQKCKGEIVYEEFKPHLLVC